MTTELGPVISEHKGRFGTGGAGWYLGGVWFAGGAVGTVKTLLAGEFAELPIMLVFTFGPALWLLWLVSKWKQTLIIHERGFVHNRFLRQPRIIQYEQIEEVRVHRTASGRQSLSGKSVHIQVIMYLHAGGKVVVTNDIENAEQLATYAQPGGAAAGGPNQGGAIGAQKPSPWG